MDNKPKNLTINYYHLMDLRIDYAFKLLFTKGDPRLLISLLNAIFANKKIPRVIKSLTIKNPYLEKESNEDKLSILDIRAELDDGTDILVEMHMYGLGELKAKTIRSWARVFGESLEVGAGYTAQPPTITIAFTNGSLDSLANNADTNNDKIHKLCMIMDCEDYTVFTDAMELHYIDMKSFAKAVNETNSINVKTDEEAMFVKWLSIITQKEINNKTLIENVCKSEEELSMAVSTLAMQSEDKYTRQAYQRRQDEIYFYNKNMAERAEYKRKAELEQHRADQQQHRADQQQHRADQQQHRADQAEAENEKLRIQIEKLQAQLANNN